MVLAVYSDYVCPFCYLAWPALEDLMAHGWEVELRAFELRPPPLPLISSAHPGTRAAWEREIAPRAAALGLEAHWPERRPRTRKAHELAHHARRLGMGPALHESLFRAHFARGLDIGRIDVLVQLAAELGLERSSVKVELDLDQYADAVVAEEAKARVLGIDAVPAYVLGGERVHVGLLSGAALADWLAGDDRAGNTGETEG